ncbi:recombinase family protein [Nocardioides sp.]|uniref:recombinase family protein n=1 Tax=Nocardioides sp. TaxID=35761 RepID=UPI0027365C76|nr:recombinase family protein [Nocardioides sp.]MDP3893518.1 recombinase family protein [Nocardioides sp.]
MVEKQAVATEGKPWAIYARLSKAATGDLEKVEYQVDLCRNYAKSRDLPVSEAHIYVDNSLSAWKKRVRRPAWEDLMAAAERGDIAGILVYAVDRFTRRPKDLETLIELAEDHGLMIEGPRSGRLDLTTATGRQQARWMAMQAASESDNTSERIKVTLARKMRDGKPMGGGRSFGFEVGGEVQVPAEVAVIREVASRLLAGEPLQRLAAEMNARGLTTVRGGPWNGSNLGRLLGGHRYGGLVEHHGQIVGQMKGEPVLDRDTYDGVQALLASRRRGRRASGEFLLTGLLTCSTCQRTMNGAHRYKALADGTKPRVYRCPPQLGGCGRVILADRTEELVGDKMVERLADPSNAAKIVAENAHLNEARAAQQARLQAVEEQLIELEVKKAAGEIIPAAYDRAKPILDKRWAALDAGLKDLSPASAMTNYDAAIEWDGLNDEEKRAVIREYRVRIEILPMQPGTRRFDPSRVTFP